MYKADKAYDGLGFLRARSDWRPRDGVGVGLEHQVARVRLARHGRDALRLRDVSPLRARSAEPGGRVRALALALALVCGHTGRRDERAGPLRRLRVRVSSVRVRALRRHLQIRVERVLEAVARGHAAERVNAELRGTGALAVVQLRVRVRVQYTTSASGAIRCIGLILHSNAFVRKHMFATGEHINGLRALRHGANGSSSNAIDVPHELEASEALHESHTRKRKGEEMTTAVGHLCV